MDILEPISRFESLSIIDLVESLLSTSESVVSFVGGCPMHLNKERVHVLITQSANKFEMLLKVLNQNAGSSQQVEHFHSLRCGFV